MEWKACAWYKTPLHTGLVFLGCMTRDSHSWQLFLGIDAWTVCACILPAHSAAVVGTRLMTGSKLVTYKLLQRSAGFLYMDRK